MRRSMQGMGRVMALAASVAVLPAGVAAQAVEATDENDRSAHAFASAVDLGELQQSMLAVQRATNAEVRSFAQQMIADHSNALHTREMLMQTERSGLLPRMNHGGGSGTGATLSNSGGGTGVQVLGGPARNGQPVVASTGEQGQGSGGATVSNSGGGTGVQVLGGPAGSGNAQGQGSGSGTGTGTGTAQGSGSGAGTGAGAHAHGGAHAGHGNMAGGQAAGGAHAGHGAMAGGGAPMASPEMMNQLHGILAAHPMSRTVMASNAQNLQVLQGITGPQFDASYMDAQIGAHRYALTNIDRILQQGDLGDDITGVLRMMRTSVAGHLELAQQIRARLGS